MGTLAALPPGLHPAWSEIDATERRIVAAMQAEDFTALPSLATARHECIVRFFEQFPEEPASVALRLDLLQQLIARNGALLEDSRARLSIAASASAQASHSRRAVEAYQDQR